MTDHLTYQQLRQAIARLLLRRTLYYTTQPDIKRGKTYIAKETKFAPEFIVCHPDDLPQIESTGVALKHIRDWRPKAIAPDAMPTSTCSVDRPCLPAGRGRQAPEHTSSILAIFEKSLWELSGS